MLSLIALGCVKKPDRDVVTDVSIEGGPSVDADDALEGMATAETPRFLGIFYGVYEYETFDENVLARDLERIERFYRKRGYYEAKVTAARVVHEKADVKVEIQVHEGAPVMTREVTLTGIELLPIDVSTEALKAMKLQPEQRFDEDLFEETKRAIGDTLADKGYAFVEVKSTARVDIAHHEAYVRYEVKPGPLARYGPIRIVFVGKQEIPERPVRANLDIREGRRYSRTAVRDARLALVKLGVFSNVDVKEDTSHPETGVVPITVFVTESTLRAVNVGVGARYDVLELETHARLGWEDRNFLGGMRRFSIDDRPGLVFFPTRFGFNHAPTRVLLENKLRTELKQPSFIEGRTTGRLAGEYNIYPLLFPIEASPFAADQPEVQRVIGYHEVKGEVGVERFFFRHHFWVSPAYNWQADYPFTYQGDIPDGLEHVIVSFPALQTNIDFRDDRIHPHKGIFVSNDLQVAGFVFGGTVSDVRVKPEARIYLPLARDKRWTLALRSTVGFLFPSNYGKTLDPSTAQGKTILTDPIDPDVIRDQHKLLFRAFYSGGPTSNRGYGYREVGPHGPVGFLIPTGQNCSLDRPGVTLDNLPDTCKRPLGGLTLWEASFEVRFPIAGALGGAVFADASDVTRRVGEIRFNFPHISVGPGLRYDTPVGPLRLDIGYRLPFAQQIGQAEPRADEGTPQTIFGLPIAVYFAFGEAF